MRGEFAKPEFNPEVRTITDLKEGMVLNGVVTNLTAFGAFVDVGVHQEGLVHISAITRKFIRDASEALSVGQRVKVKVVSVDAERKRISLSMKELEPPLPPRKPRKPARPALRRQEGGKEKARPGRPQRGPRPPRLAVQAGQPRRLSCPTPVLPRRLGRDSPLPQAGQTAAVAQASSMQRRPSPWPQRPWRPRRPRRRQRRRHCHGSHASLRGAQVPAATRAPRRFRERREGGPPRGAGKPGTARREARQAGPAKPVEPGKPDYSKFFVRGKRKEREGENAAPDAGTEGASREEVRQVMRAQESGGTSLADLLRKAGVSTEEKKP